MASCRKGCNASPRQGLSWKRRRAEDGELRVVASVCSTHEDSQGLSLQSQSLRRAGVEVFHSNAQATEYCVSMLQGG
jgi:hypothetical protein